MMLRNPIQRALCLAFALMLMLTHLAIGIETAGELFVDLDAATLSPGDTVWANAGTYTDFQAAGAPVVGKIETTPAVFFDGIDDAFVATDVAPSGLVGIDPTRSIEVWTLNPSILQEETLVGWGHRGGPDGTNMAFNYGFAGRWGAVGHWGGDGPDVGWIDNDWTDGSPEARKWHHLVYTYDEETTRVYSDGELWNSEDTGLLYGGLDTYDNTPIAIASQWNSDGSDLEPGIKGSLAIGRVRVHDGVLTDSQILANYNEEKDSFVNPLPPQPPVPEPIPASPVHRYSFSNPASNDATDATISDSIGGADGVVLGDGSSFTGSQLQLDGGSSDFAAYVDLPSGLISGLTDATLEAWITIDGPQSWARIFDFGSNSPGGPDGELDGPGDDNGGNTEGLDYFMLAASRGDDTNLQQVAIRNEDPAGGGQNVVDFTDVKDVPSESLHYAVVYDSHGEPLTGSPAVKVYRDGKLVADGTASIPLSEINDVNNWLGRSNWTNDANFEGTYDEFRIYDYALTQNQVLGNTEAGPDVVNSPDVEPALRAGDADQDLDFDQLDLVRVQVAAKYVTGLPATWGEGDWDGAPGGKQGAPPAGNGRFDQLDIVAALTAGIYLKGPYASVRGGGQQGDGQTSIVYDAGSGEVSVDAPAGAELTSINIDSLAAIFTGDAAQNLGGSFDNDADNNIFKATFGSSFGSITFGPVAPAGLSQEFLLGDLTVVGSLAGGGDLGNVDLVYIPEPAAIWMLAVGMIALLARRRH